MRPYSFTIAGVMTSHTPYMNTCQHRDRCKEFAVHLDRHRPAKYKKKRITIRRDYFLTSESLLGPSPWQRNQTDLNMLVHVEGTGGGGGGVAREDLIVTVSTD